ncbi:MAG: NAD(P)/FAD-dependent oxidoreductase [Acidimicrobiales bacterium]
MKVVVVGAGIVGVSAALTLAERGVEVVVVDRGPVAGEASGLNAGLISGGGWGDRPDVEVTLRMGSRNRFIDLSQRRGHDIGLDLTGTLTLVRTEGEWVWATATVDAARLAGRALELVTSEELVDLEPAADPGLLGAVLDPLGARAEPVAATRALAAEAVAAGAVIDTGGAVGSLRLLTGGGWEVGIEAPAGRVVGADVVVIAAGPWCGELGAMVGIEIPIVAVRGQMWATEPQPPLLRHGIAAAESALAWSDEAEPHRPPALTHRHGRRSTRHLYGRQRPGGEIVFGGDRVATAERTVDDEGIAVNRAHVAELLPPVAGLATARTWCGSMPFSLDGHPLIGPVPGHDGLFLAGGLASSGFGRGPMAGQLIADLVTGCDPGVDLADVAPGDRVRPLG